MRLRASSMETIGPSEPLPVQTRRSKSQARCDAGRHLRPRQHRQQRPRTLRCRLASFGSMRSAAGWTVVGEYVDIGISGTKEKRPELDRLMAEAHRCRFDGGS